MIGCTDISTHKINPYPWIVCKPTLLNKPLDHTTTGYENFSVFCIQGGFQDCLEVSFLFYLFIFLITNK